MFDDQDQELGPILTLVLGIAIVISLFTIAIALSVTGVFSGSSSGAAGQGAPGQAAADEAAADGARIYFDVDSSALPDQAGATLFTIVVAATVDADKRIELSGYHDASGDEAHNVELAKARAVAVRDALVAAGVPRDRIDLRKPIEVRAGDDARMARRVDIGLR